MKMALLYGIILISISSYSQQLLWSEEFNTGSVPDSDIWSYDTGSSGWGNAELQNYTTSSSNVKVENGNLVITAIKSGNNISSGRIKTIDKFHFKYGTVEARIQTPDLENGLWPAFWLMGNNYSQVGWPLCGEIDVMEMGSASAISDGVINRRVSSAAHWHPQGDYPQYTYSDTRTQPSDIDGTYVIYRMQWTPTYVSTFINGQQIWTMDISGSDEFMFRESFFFILNLAVGGNYPQIWNRSQITALNGSNNYQAEYKVDYIRLYDNGYTELGGTSQAIQDPYLGTPIAIPGTLQVENYDNGGQNVAYYDTSTVNEGDQYGNTFRSDEGVDLGSNGEGGISLGWAAAGEWLEYTVDVDSNSMDFEVSARVALGQSGTGSFRLEVDGQSISDSIIVPNTGGWQTWTEVTEDITLNPGEQIIRVHIENGPMNLDRLVFTEKNAAPQFTQDPIVLEHAFITAPFSQSIVSKVTDVNAGETFSFSGNSIPTWLQMGADGTISGTPSLSDLGLHTFSVQVQDSGGLTDTATIEVTVQELPSVISTLVNESTLALGWSYIASNFTLYHATSLGGNEVWLPVNETVLDSGTMLYLTIPMDESQGFYRLQWE